MFNARFAKMKLMVMKGWEFYATIRTFTSSFYKSSESVPPLLHVPLWLDASLSTWTIVSLFFFPSDFTPLKSADLLTWEYKLAGVATDLVFVSFPVLHPHRSLSLPDEQHCSKYTFILTVSVCLSQKLYNSFFNGYQQLLPNVSVTIV